MHLNISTLLPNFEELKQFVHKYNMDIVSLNETRLDSSISDSTINIPNYNLLNRNGGGVALYIKQHLYPSKVDTDLTTESVWAYVQVKSKKIVIGSVYRPPSSTANYFDNIIDDLDKVSSMEYEIIVLGDFNYNFLSSSESVISRISRLESTFDIKQLISSPTRITIDCSSLIHHISTSLNCVESRVIDLSLSDHHVVYAVFDHVKCKYNPRILKCRNFNNFDQETFLHQTAHSNIFKDILSVSDVHIASTLFKQEYLVICNTNAPIREIKIRDRFNPWFSDEILHAICVRDLLYKLAKKTAWKTHGPVITSRLSNPNTTVNEMWKVLKDVLPGNKISSNKHLPDPQTFNDFFSSVGK